MLYYMSDYLCLTFFCAISFLYDYTIYRCKIRQCSNDSQLKISTFFFFWGSAILKVWNGMTGVISKNHTFWIFLRNQIKLNMTTPSRHSAHRRSLCLVSDSATDAKFHFYLQTSTGLKPSKPHYHYRLGWWAYRASYHHPNLKTYNFFGKKHQNLPKLLHNSTACFCQHIPLPWAVRSFG